METVSKEEIERRIRLIERSKQIESSITQFGDHFGQEHENPYKAEAMLNYINKDKDVPDELIEKIKRYEQKRMKCRKRKDSIG